MILNENSINENNRENIQQWYWPMPNTWHSVAMASNLKRRRENTRKWRRENDVYNTNTMIMANNQ